MKLKQISVKRSEKCRKPMGPQDMVTLRSVRKLVNCGLFLLLQNPNSMHHVSSSLSKENPSYS